MVLGKRSRRLWILTVIVFMCICFSIKAGADSNKAVQGSSVESEDQALSASRFVAVGIIEGFTMDRVYIDGVDYALAKDVEYYSNRGEQVKRAWIKQGFPVKYVLGPQRDVEVIQMIEGDDDDE